jgi:hypothetical protein
MASPTPGVEGRALGHGSGVKGHGGPWPGDSIKPVRNRSSRASRRKRVSREGCRPLARHALNCKPREADRSLPKGAAPSASEAVCEASLGLSQEPNGRRAFASPGTYIQYCKLAIKLRNRWAAASNSSGLDARSRRSKIAAPDRSLAAPPRGPPDRNRRRVSRVRPACHPAAAAEPAAPSIGHRSIARCACRRFACNR